MKTRTTLILVFVLVIGMALSGYLLSARMSGPLAVHWNAAGQADGYGSRFMALYFTPLLTVAVSLLILAIPTIDPLGKNVESFRPTLNLFVLLMALFLAYLHGLTLAWNLGARFNFSQLLVPAMGLLFIFLGALLGKTRPNWFIGIRTPWTLSNPVVWEKTHALGGKLFILAGLISLFGVLFPHLAVYFLLVPLLTATVLITVYSYVEYQRIAR